MTGAGGCSAAEVSGRMVLSRQSPASPYATWCKSMPHFPLLAGGSAADLSSLKAIVSHGNFCLAGRRAEQRRAGQGGPAMVLAGALLVLRREQAVGDCKGPSYFQTNLQNLDNPWHTSPREHC